MNKLVLCAIFFSALAAALLGYNAPLNGSKVVFQAPAITATGSGTMVTFQLSMSPGTGGILVDVGNAFYQQDSENSLRKARYAAERFLGTRLSGYDLKLEIQGQRIVGGESAGAVFAAAIASAYSGRPLRPDVTGSAAISPDGESLVPIDGIDEKMRAAAAAGKRYFVVAQNQTVPNEGQLASQISIVRAADAASAISAMLG